MDRKLPMVIRILGISLFAVLALYRFLILMVSLPPHGPAPEGPFFRRFFIAETNQLTTHLAEAAATTTETWQCNHGSSLSSSLYYFILTLILTLILSSSCLYFIFILYDLHLTYTSSSSYTSSFNFSFPFEMSFAKQFHFPSSQRPRLQGSVVLEIGHAPWKFQKL